MQPLVLEEALLRRLCPVGPAALGAVEDSFRWLAEGKVTMPPIMHIGVPEHHGEVDIKSAYCSALDRFAVKIGSGYFDNPKVGLPSSGSTMVVLNAKTGLLYAVLLENGYLTNLRTGMAGAVAAKYLAAPGTADVGLIGAGAQARFQLECLRLVRDVRSVRVFSRDAGNTQAFAAATATELGIEIIACASAEEVARASSIIVTTTPAREAVVLGAWLRPGTHITAVGSDTRGKRELDEVCLDRAQIIACDNFDQCANFGELQYAAPDRQRGASVHMLADIVAGRASIDRMPDAISIADLTGLGIQDTAIAAHAVAMAAQPA